MYGCAADADKRFIVKKKKTSKLLMPVIMLVLTAALLIAYLALGKSDPAGDETDTGDTNSEVTIILQRDASTITELSYTLHGEKPLTFATMQPWYMLLRRGSSWAMTCSTPGFWSPTALIIP